LFDRPVIGDTKPQNVLIAVAVGGAVEGFIQQMADCYGLSVGVQWREQLSIPVDRGVSGDLRFGVLIAV